jgi:hypothetical protein
MGGHWYLAWVSSLTAKAAADIAYNHYYNNTLCMYKTFLLVFSTAAMFIQMILLKKELMLQI